MVDPGITIFPKPTKDKSSRKPSNEDSASHEDIGFQENGDQTKVSETRSLASSHQGENLMKDAVPSQYEADAVRALDHEKQVLSAINSTNVAPPLAARNSNHLLESAREILAIHDRRTSSSCKAAQDKSFAAFKETRESGVRNHFGGRPRKKVRSRGKEAEGARTHTRPA